MTTPRTFPMAAAGAVLLASVTAGVAGADTITVATAHGGEHTHVLEVKDLTGADLTDLALTPGVARTFRVGVRTTPPTTMTSSPDPLRDYTVESSLTDLYATDGGGAYDFSAEAIPSSQVTLSYATSPLEVRDATGRVDPDYALSATGIDCDAIAGALGGIDVLTIATTPTCVLLAALGGGGLSFSDIPVEGRILEGIDLSGLLPSQLPLIPQAGVDDGPFTTPDCLNGAGGLDPDCPSGGVGTQHTMLEAAPATVLAPEISAKVTATAPATLASLGGTGAKTSLTDVITALQLSGDSDVADFANALVQDFDTTEQLSIVNTLLSAGAPVLADISDVVGVGALNNAFPSLVVDPDSAPSGSYSGTLTITLIECPSCP